MKIVLRYWLIIGLVAGMLTVLSGCVATTGGYGGPAEVYEVDYYESYGYDYNRLGPRYHVAPPRGDRDDHGRPNRAENRPAQPVYRPAPPSRPVPSIPTQPHPEPRGSGERKK